MDDIKNIIDKDNDYTLIKSGAKKTLILVKQKGVIKGNVLCYDFMKKSKIDNFKLLDINDINDNCLNQNNHKPAERRPFNPEQLSSFKLKLKSNTSNTETVKPNELKKEEDKLFEGGKHSHKKTYHKRDKFGRFIKRKTRKSSGGWLY